MMQEDQGIPIFPPFCATKVSDSEECSLWGITLPCHKAFSDETVENFGFGLLASHIWTFVVTLVIGVVSLWNIKGPLDFRRHSLKATCGFYAIETSFFAIIRFFFGVCKPLVAFAALHNLFEWSIVLHVAQGTTNWNVLRKRLSMAALFINIQIITCLCVPDFEASLGLEMVFGLMLDFGIPLLFLSQFSDPHRKQMYWYAAVAHCVHLVGTILPLVFAIHLSSHASWFGGFFLEILINVSVPLTHFLYCYWSHQIDYVASENGITVSLVGEKRHVSDDKDSSLLEKVHCSLEKDRFMSEKDWKTQQTSGAMTVETSEKEDIVKTILAEVKQYHEPCKCGMAKERRIRDVWRFLSIGFFLGLVPLLVVPKLLMSECEQGDHCVTRSYVTKTSVIAPGERSLAMTLQSPGRSAIESILKTQNPGLLDVHLMRSDGPEINDNAYHCVETWKDIASMKEAPMSVSNVMAGTNVQAIDMFTQVQATTCRGREAGTMRMTTNIPCGSVWTVLESGNYCGWIPGCKYVKESDGILSLYMKDGNVVNAVSDTSSRFSSHIAVLSQKELSGFEGRLMLKEDSATGLCEVNYSFQLLVGEGSVQSSVFYHTFIEKFIPELRERSRD